MKLRTARRLSLLLYFLLIITALAAVTLRRPALSWLMLVLLVAAPLFDHHFCRCPHCGAYIQDIWGSCCSRCGEDLE